MTRRYPRHIDEFAAEDAELRSVIDEFAEAFRTKDLERIMTVFSPDVVSFDITPPLRCVGAGQLREHWTKTFAAYPGPIEYQVTDLTVTVGSRQSAIAHSLNWKSGVVGDGTPSQYWLRWTACFAKIGGRWLITHEHVSVPFDPPSGRAVLDLTPSFITEGQGLEPRPAADVSPTSATCSTIRRNGQRPSGEGL